MGLFKKIGLVLKESIVSPSTESYIIEKGSETLVVRSGGNYEGIDLSGVDLSATRLNNANFRGANLKEAKLDHADLTYLEQQSPGLILNSLN